VPLALPLHYSVRPLEGGDRDALAVAFARLSPESRLRRFLGPKPALSPRELTLLTDIDHVTHEALAAIDETDGRIVAVARYNAWEGREGVADLAVTVIDEWQGRRIGTRLAVEVVQRARVNGFGLVTGTTFWDNRPARKILRRLGFHAVGGEAGLLDLELRLA
jgi:RimJ/RimL family protein N-acetyltransferase